MLNIHCSANKYELRYVLVYVWSNIIQYFAFIDDVVLMRI